MKKAAGTLLLFVNLALRVPAAVPGLRFEAGALYGPRFMAGADIRSVYGRGSVYYPYAELNWRGLFIGAGYEGARPSRGNIGIYEEASSFQLRGFDVFVGYGLKLRFVTPYVRIGCGTFAYRQTVDSQYVENDKVDRRRATITLGIGARMYFFRHLFISGEGRYVPLEVSPFGQTVNLSGLRLLAGIGFSL